MAELGKDAPQIIVFLLLLGVLAFVVVNFGYARPCDIPGFEKIYYQVMGYPRIAILHGDDGIGNPEALRSVIVERTNQFPELLHTDFLIGSGILDRYSMVIVERAKTIDTAKLAAIRDYVQKGGRLVWVGDSGTALGENDYVCEDVSFEYSPSVIQQLSSGAGAFAEVPSGTGVDVTGGEVLRGAGETAVGSAGEVGEDITEGARRVITPAGISLQSNGNGFKETMVPRIVTGYNNLRNGADYTPIYRNLDTLKEHALYKMIRETGSDDRLPADAILKAMEQGTSYPTYDDANRALIDKMAEESRPIADAAFIDSESTKVARALERLVVGFSVDAGKIIPGGAGLIKDTNLETELLNLAVEGENALALMIINAPERDSVYGDSAVALAQQRVNALLSDNYPERTRDISVKVANEALDKYDPPEIRFVIRKFMTTWKLFTFYGFRPGGVPLATEAIVEDLCGVGTPCGDQARTWAEAAVASGYIPEGTVRRKALHVIFTETGRQRIYDSIEDGSIDEDTWDVLKQVAEATKDVIVKGGKGALAGLKLLYNYIVGEPYSPEPLPAQYGEVCSDKFITEKIEKPEKGFGGVCGRTFGDVVVNYVTAYSDLVATVNRAYGDQASGRDGFCSVEEEPLKTSGSERIEACLEKVIVAAQADYDAYLNARIYNVTSRQPPQRIEAVYNAIVASEYSSIIHTSTLEVFTPDHALNYYIQEPVIVDQICSSGINYWQRGPSETLAGTKVRPIDFGQSVLGLEFIDTNEDIEANLLMTPIDPSHPLVKGYEASTEWFGVEN